LVRGEGSATVRPTGLIDNRVVEAAAYNAGL
jgi:hypothetical protein